MQKCAYDSLVVVGHGQTHVIISHDLSAADGLGLTYRGQSVDILTTTMQHTAQWKTVL